MNKSKPIVAIQGVVRTSGAPDIRYIRLDCETDTAFIGQPLNLERGAARFLRFPKSQFKVV